MDIITYTAHIETKVDNLLPLGVKRLVECYEFGG